MQFITELYGHELRQKQLLTMQICLDLKAHGDVIFIVKTIYCASLALNPFRTMNLRKPEE